MHSCTPALSLLMTYRSLIWPFVSVAPDSFGSCKNEAPVPELGGFVPVHAMRKDSMTCAHVSKET
jgi:hypothetical protein